MAAALPMSSCSGAASRHASSAAAVARAGAGGGRGCAGGVGAGAAARHATARGRPMRGRVRTGVGAGGGGGGAVAAALCVGHGGRGCSMQAGGAAAGASLRASHACGGEGACWQQQQVRVWPEDGQIAGGAHARSGSRVAPSEAQDSTPPPGTQCLRAGVRGARPCAVRPPARPHVRVRHAPRSSAHVCIAQQQQQPLYTPQL